MKKSHLLVLFACFLPFIAINAAHATSINIDFGVTDTTTPNTYGAAGQAGTWNQITSLGVTNNLVDIAGTTTSVALDVGSDYFGNDCSTASTNNANKPLLCDNFFSNISTSWSLDVTGLTNGTYNLILYAPSNSFVTTGNMIVNGTSVPELSGSLSNVLSDGLTYSIEQILVTNGQISLSGDPASTQFAGLSGIQISAVVPVPAALWLFSSGLLGLVGIARHKKAT